MHLYCYGSWFIYSLMYAMLRSHPPLQQLSFCKNRALACSCTPIASFILHLYHSHVVHLKRCCVLLATTTIRSRVSYVCNMKMILIGFDIHFWVLALHFVFIFEQLQQSNSQCIAFANGSCCCGLWKNKCERNKQARSSSYPYLHISL